MIAAGLHGHGQIARAAERADKQRHQQRYHGLGALNDIARFKIRAAGHLRLHDLVGLFQQRGDKAQGDGHHHGQLVGGKADPGKGAEQPLQAVGQHHGRGGQRQQAGARHQKDQAGGEAQRRQQALQRNLNAPHMHQHRIAGAEKQVEQEGENQDEPQRLQPLGQQL